ncbi:MAG: PRC-barrel domain-containing protein [Novosphingobium sp.]
MDLTPEQAADDAADAHRLILAGRVLNTPVYNHDGERIGHIDDLSIERETGQTRYAILSFGGFLGIGEKFHPLPWQVLRFDPTRGGFVVPLDKAALADAPHYDRAELARLGGESHRIYSEAILEYYGRYGVAPYF